MAAVIPELPLLNLSTDERALMDRLRSDLSMQKFDMELLDCYYNGEQLVRSLKISIPPELEGLHTVVGWPRIGVDALEQRLELEAFRWADGGDASDLDEMATGNDLLDEATLAHTDALCFGREYLAAGSRGPDDPGDPDLPLMTLESPLHMIDAWDARYRKTTAALRECEYDGERMSVLYLPNETITCAQDRTGWQVVDRDRHGLGVVPVVRMANRQRTSKRNGQSEITHEVMSITDAACRSLMGMEVAREFFAAPQRYILGASESAFQDAEGNPLSAWQTYIGRVLGLERDDEGNVPEVGQFPAGDPSAFTRIVDLYARIMATQLGLPPHYLGYTTDNPASADAIRSSEAQLVKRAERRIRRFGSAWSAWMRLGLWVRDGVEPDRSRRIVPVWRNPATPTVAAQTDSAVKLVQAGVLPPRSEVTLELAGLTEAQRKQVAADWDRDDASRMLEGLGRELPQPRSGEGVGAPTV